MALGLSLLLAVPPIVLAQSPAVAGPAQGEWRLFEVHLEPYGRKDAFGSGKFSEFVKGLQAAAQKLVSTAAPQAGKVVEQIPKALSTNGLMDVWFIFVCVVNGKIVASKLVDDPGPIPDSDAQFWQFDKSSGTFKNKDASERGKVEAKYKGKIKDPCPPAATGGSSTTPPPTTPKLKAWPGSSMDDGLGHLINVLGRSIEAQNADGTTTYTSESTTTMKGKDSGQLIETITRTRHVTKTNPPAAASQETVKFESTEETVMNGSAGVSTKETLTYSSTGGAWESTALVQEFDSPDAKGNVRKGESKTVTSTGATRTTAVSRWDPERKAWQKVDERTAQLQTSKDPAIYLPESASAGGVVIGTVETEVQAVAAGVVVAQTPDGRQGSVLVEPTGRFVVPSTLLMAGTLALTIKDQAGTTLANKTVRVAAPRGDAAAPPMMTEAPPILPAGAVGRLNGTNLCNAESLDGPGVILTTQGTSQSTRVLAASDQEIKIRVPSTVSPGAGSLVVENGTGQLSRPSTTNPVKISVTTPPQVRINQQFDAAVAIQGLTAENLKRPLTATVVVSGNATFPGNKREMQVPISNGGARVPLIAHAPGAYEVRVTSISGP